MCIRCAQRKHPVGYLLRLKAYVIFVSEELLKVYAFIVLKT